MYHYLCLSGGGIKLISFIGTLKYLTQNNYINIKKLKQIIGVSAGSIIAFLITIGYTIDELEDFILNFHFNKLLSEFNTEKLLFDYGIADTNNIKKLLSILLYKKINKKNITFLELFNLHKIKLDIGVSNITKNNFEIFNHINKPNMNVIDAIIISCSLPIIFKPIKINNCLYSDGGVLNNFPLQYFNKKNLHNVISIVSKSKNSNNIDNVFDYLNKVIFNVISNNTNITIQNYQHNTNIIQVISHINTIDFNINKDIIQNEINIGFQSAKNFFKNKTNITRRNSF